MRVAYKLLAAIGVTGGCGGAYFVVKSQSSHKEKMVTADFNKRGVWKSIFLTHKEDTNFKSIFTLTGSEALDTAANSIKDKCRQLVDSYSKDLVEKWCVNPIPKTVEARLYLEDYELASDDDDRKNLFVLNKESEDFINSIKAGDTGFTKNSQKDAAKEKISTYCSSKMSVSAEDLSYENVKN